MLTICKQINERKCCIYRFQSIIPLNIPASVYLNYKHCFPVHTDYNFKSTTHELTWNRLHLPVKCTAIYLLLKSKALVQSAPDIVKNNPYWNCKNFECHHTSLANTRTINVMCDCVKSAGAGCQIHIFCLRVFPGNNLVHLSRVIPVVLVPLKYL